MVPSSFFFFVLLFFNPGAYSHPTHSSLSRREQFELLKSVEIQGTEYTLNPLPLADQGSFSDAYQILEPFMDTYAILKVVRETDKTALEVAYLKKIGLLLHAEASKTVTGAYYIVVVDVESQDPPYKPFFRWYLEDTEMDLKAALLNMRRAAGNELFSIATKKGLLYYDFHMGNVFATKGFEHAAPIDWGPPMNKKAGVIEIKEEQGTEEYEAKLEKFQNKLKAEIRVAFSIKELDTELRKRDEELRPKDVALLKEEESGQA